MKTNGDKQGPTLPVYRPPVVTTTTIGVSVEISHENLQKLVRGGRLPPTVVLDLRLGAAQALDTLDQYTRPRHAP